MKKELLLLKSEITKLKVSVFEKSNDLKLEIENVHLQRSVIEMSKSSNTNLSCKLEKCKEDLKSQKIHIASLEKQFDDFGETASLKS